RPALAQLPDPHGGGAPGHEHAGARLGRRSHQKGDDRPPPRAGPAAPARPADPPDPRRAAAGGAGGGGGGGPRPRTPRDGGSPRPGRPAGGRRPPRRDLGRRALRSYLAPPVERARLDRLEVAATCRSTSTSAIGTGASS